MSATTLYVIVVGDMVLKDALTVFRFGAFLKFCFGDVILSPFDFRCRRRVIVKVRLSVWIFTAESIRLQERVI